MRFYENDNKIDSMLKNTLDSIKSLIDTNTVVGEAIKGENCTIIPISKVSVGFVVGGGEYSDNSTRRVANHYPMSGGTGGGMSVTPIGFLIDDGIEVKYINIEDKSMYQTVLNLINKIINKLGDDGEKEVDL